MIYKIAYGKTGLTIDLPPGLNVDVIEPICTTGVPDERKSISEALMNPYNSKPLKETIKKGDKVGIIFSDNTRATPYPVILPPLLDELRGIPKKDITFFCANGTHRLVTDLELEMILGADIVKDYNIIQNEAGKPHLYKYCGITGSGNEIFLHHEILKCDVKILTGFIEPHFFAGFSGGAKALVPGMASVGTIKYNHSIKHLSHTNASWGITDGNPLWEEVMEAAGFVPGLFLLNVALNRNREITGDFAGELKAAHNAGCKFVKESAMVPVEKCYDIVITSNSGHPLDLNIYQTVKGMSAAARIVKKGGSVIVAAECRDGMPPGSDYETMLSSVKNPDELMDLIKIREPELKDTWQIYCQANVQQKADVYLFSKLISSSTIRKALLKPVESIENLVQVLVQKIGAGASICIMPEGPLTIPYLHGEIRYP